VNRPQRGRSFGGRCRSLAELREVDIPMGLVDPTGDDCAWMFAGLDSLDGGD